tara:strand:- start:713 stop:952 length:240 start_codon:yes stop_codon:yes gene_type:complete
MPTLENTETLPLDYEVNTIMARLMNEEELLEFYETNLQLAQKCRADNEHSKADTFDTLNYHIGKDLYRFNIELEYSADA